MKSTNIVKLIIDAPSLIQVNGVWVPKKDVISMEDRIKKLEDKING